MKHQKKNKLIFISIIFLCLAILSLNLFSFSQKINLKSKAAEIKTNQYLKKINMTHGKILKDKIIYQEKIAEQFSNTQIVNQTIPVTFGVAQQVIIEHCDEYLDTKNAKYTDWSVDPVVPCEFVKKLVMTDFETLQNDFAGTGKAFVFDGFDASWDQSVKQDGNCGQAGGGQFLPYLDCHHDKKSVYISVLYAPNANHSGGEALSHLRSFRYTVPGKYSKDIDYWELKSQDFGYTTSLVITHEMGHLFGQIHPPFIAGKDNKILPGINHELFYHGDLSPQSPGKSYDWVKELTKHSQLGNETIVRDSIPESSKIIFFNPTQDKFSLKTNQGLKIDVYGFIGTEPRLLYDQFTLNDFFYIHKTYFGVYPLLLFIITDGSQNKYYSWLNIAKMNFIYWEGNEESATLQLLAEKYQSNAGQIIAKVTANFNVRDRKQKIQVYSYYKKYPQNTPFFNYYVLDNFKKNVSNILFFDLHPVTNIEAVLLENNKIKTYGQVTKCTGKISGTTQYPNSICELNTIGDVEFKITQ